MKYVPSLDLVMLHFLFSTEVPVFVIFVGCRMWDVGLGQAVFAL